MVRGVGFLGRISGARIAMRPGECVPVEQLAHPGGCRKLWRALLAVRLKRSRCSRVGMAGDVRDTEGVDLSCLAADSVAVGHRAAYRRWSWGGRDRAAAST